MEVSTNTIQKLRLLREHGFNAIEDLNEKYFINFQNNTIEVENILKLLDENICSFREIIGKFKSIKDEDFDPCLYYLLQNKKFFEELMQSTRLTKEDLRYLLNTIDNIDELQCLCWNTSLIKYILNEFMLNTEDVDKFNTIAEKTEECKEYNMHTIFEYIEYNENNEEILKLNELNKKGYLLNNFDLTKDQKLELSEVLKDNKQSQNTLIQIVDNHLEDQYDFKSLKNLLTKEDRKSLKTRFNF